MGMCISVCLLTRRHGVGVLLVYDLSIVVCFCRAKKDQDEKKSREQINKFLADDKLASKIHYKVLGINDLTV